MAFISFPLPRCITSEIREPEHIIVQEGDITALDEIRSFGHSNHMPQNEIEQNCNLASGFSDIIIILERPASNHDYDMAFTEFVGRCPTLDATDRLIKLSSKRQRSIHTVTVLDAFAFQPKGSPERESLEGPWHDTMEKIIHIKRPRVVLCCWKQPCGHPLISQLSSHGLGKSAWEMIHLDDHPIFLRKSFHPAAVVCYGQQRVFSQALLISDFVVAFAMLAGGRTEEHAWIKHLNEEVVRREEWNSNGGYEHSHIQRRTIRILRELLEEPMEVGRRQRPRTSHFTQQERTRKEEQKMFGLLRRLTLSDFDGGSIYIGHLHVMWSNYCHPAKKHVLEMLRTLGTKQHRFVASHTESPTSEHAATRHLDSSDTFDNTGLEDGVRKMCLATDTDMDMKDVIQENNSSCHKYLLMLEDCHHSATTAAMRLHSCVRLRIGPGDEEIMVLQNTTAKLCHEFTAIMNKVAALFRSVGAAALKGMSDAKSGGFNEQFSARDFDRVTDDIHLVADKVYHCHISLSGLVAMTEALVPEPRSADQGVMLGRPWSEASRDIRQSFTSLQSLRSELSKREEEIAF